MSNKKVGVFTVVKNEHKFLGEWVQYYKDLGFDDIRVYSDINSKSHAEICKDYDVYHGSVKDIVSVDVNKKFTASDGNQVMYFKAILDKLKSTTDLDWVAYVDVDEFITIQDSRTIQDVMCDFGNAHVVVMQWQNYNANGHIFSPEGKVVDVYKTTCQHYAPPRMSPIASTKMFFNLKRWDSAKLICNMHLPKSCCLWCKTDLSRDLNKLTYDRLYIRHYITKSFEDYCYKLFDRGQFFGSKQLSHFFSFNPDISEDDPNVKELIDSYYNKYLNGDIDFYIKVK